MWTLLPVTARGPECRHDFDKHRDASVGLLDVCGRSKSFGKHLTSPFRFPYLRERRSRLDQRAHARIGMLDQRRQGPPCGNGAGGVFALDDPRSSGCEQDFHYASEPRTFRPPSSLRIRPIV